MHEVQSTTIDGAADRDRGEGLPTIARDPSSHMKLIDSTPNGCAHSGPVEGAVEKGEVHSHYIREVGHLLDDGHMTESCLSAALCCNRRSAWGFEENKIARARCPMKNLSSFFSTTEEIFKTALSKLSRF